MLGAIIVATLFSAGLIIGGVGLFVVAVVADRPGGGGSDSAFLMRMACGGVALGILVFVLTVCSGPASADTLCMPWPKFKEALAKVYGEKPIGGGLAGPDTGLQVFASPGGSTFTILAVQRDGLACVAARGTEWSPGTVPAAKPVGQEN